MQTDFFCTLWLPTTAVVYTEHSKQVQPSSFLTSLSSMPSLLTAQATSDKSKPIVATESTYLCASRDSEL